MASAHSNEDDAQATTSSIIQPKTSADAQISSKSSPANTQPDSLDGGWGWVVVFSSFIIYVLVFGTLRCQSVLFVPIMNEFSAHYSSVGWVAALASSGLAVAGIVSAPLMAKFGHRTTIMIGGLVACCSTVVSSFATSVLLLDIFAGLLTGIGLGMSFVSAPVLIGFYFKKRRALATNIASIGASVGTFLMCPLNGWLIKSFDIRGYFLVLGGVFLHLCVAGSLMRPVSLSLHLAAKRGKAETQEGKALMVEEVCEGVETDEVEEKPKDQNAASQVERPKASWTSLFTNPAYIVYCISQVVFLSGFIVNQLYIVPFAELELGVSSLQAPLIMSIAAVTEVLSRIAFGILGDVKRVNRVLMFAGVLLVLSVCAFLIPFTTSFATLAALAAVTGLFQGGFSGISVVIVADIVGLKLYGTALGISTFINGIGTLVSPPLVGMAVDYTGKPSTAIFISAAILFTGSILSFMIQVAITQQAKRKIGNSETS